MTANWNIEMLPRILLARDLRGREHSRSTLHERKIVPRSDNMPLLRMLFSRLL